MKSFKTRIISLFSAAAMLLTTLPAITASAVNGLTQENVKITYTGQVVDTFMGVSARYATYYEWSGPYSCAAYIDNFYYYHFGVNLYDINNYKGKPRVYYPIYGHTAELVAVKNPIPGDIAQDKDYSHVAIVKDVSNSTVTLIEQNWKWNDWATGDLVCTVNRKIGINDYYFYRLYIDGKPKTVSQVPEDDDPVLEQPAPTTSVIKLSSVAAESVNSAGYNVRVKATDTVGIERIEFKSYPKSKGTAAAKTKTVYKTGTSVDALSAVRLYDYEYTEGTYVTAVTAYSKTGKTASKTIETVISRSAPVISGVSVSNVSASGYTVTCKVSSDSGIKTVKFPTWTSYNATDDLASDWASSSASNGKISGDTATFTVKASDHNSELGEYNTYIYAYDSCGNSTSKAVQVNLSKSVGTLSVSSISAKNYTGKPLCPAVTVKDGSTELSEGKDYRITYENNTEVGKGYVRVTGIGNYSGSKLIGFSIKPAKVTGMKVVKATTNSVEIKWNENANADGYYIYRMVRGEWVKAGDTAALSYTVTGLSIGENYELAVVAHKKVGGVNYNSRYPTALKAVTKTDRVTGVTAAADKGNVKVTWNRLSPTDGYAIYVSADGKTYTRYTCIDQPLANSTVVRGYTGKVYVKVRGYKLIGSTHYYGADSQIVTVTV